MYVGKSDKGRVYLEHVPGVVMHYGRWQQCSTDVRIWLKSPDGEWLQRNPFAHRGKGGRFDLLCNIGGWPKDVQFARVLGWAFFAKKNMGFQEYQKKELVSSKGRRRFYEYKYQVNHIQGGPENCCLEHLELGDAEYNKSMFAIDAKQLYGSVFKRPACKRPAAAMP